MERSKGSGNFKNTFTLPYGRKSINFTLPEGIEGIVIEPNPSQVLNNLEEAIKDSLQRPINSPPFDELAQAGQKVCIAVTDILRVFKDEKGILLVHKNIEITDPTFLLHFYLIFALIFL